MKAGLLLVICISFISININAQNDVFEIARRGCAEDLQYVLINYPQTINIRNSAGFTPLIIACYHGNIEVASILAEKVENIDYNSDTGTALMAAVYKDNIKIARMLLDFRADPNIADNNETTALHYAVLFRNVELIKLLVTNGADINLKDNKGFSPVDYAIQENNTSILKLLKK